MNKRVLGAEKAFNKISNVPFVNIDDAHIEIILEEMKQTIENKEPYRRLFQEYAEITTRLKGLGIHAGFNKELDFISAFLRAALERIQRGDSINRTVVIADALGIIAKELRLRFQVIFQRWRPRSGNVNIFLECGMGDTGRKLKDDITKRELAKLLESLSPFIDKRILISYVIHAELMKKLGVNVSRTPRLKKRF